MRQVKTVNLMHGGSDYELEIDGLTKGAFVEEISVSEDFLEDTGPVTIRVPEGNRVEFTELVLNRDPVGVCVRFQGRTSEVYQRTEQDRFNHPIVCLCGSTRFKAEYIAENARLTCAGKVVLTVGVFVHDTTEGYDKALLNQVHREKIKISDEVRIINPGGYIGKSTADEIEYAKSLGKSITYLEEPKSISVIKCPVCGESHYKVGNSTQTLKYYQPEIKDGVNINLDGNVTTTTYTCVPCGHVWTLTD